jgi:hypothetical protein
MPPQVIAVVNQSTVLTDVQLDQWVAGLQVQVTRDFAPAWGIDVPLTAVHMGQTAPAGAWQLVCLDNTDQAGDLGYHELTAEGLPLGKAFIKTDQGYGLEPSVTVSHELLEMLGDPWVCASCLVTMAGKPMLVSMEVCDPVEDDQFAYEVTPGVRVSNFVYPSYFTQAAKGPYDHGKTLSAPAPSLTAGGYVGEYDLASGKGWTQVFGQTSECDRGKLARGFHRRVCRATPRATWRHSTR